MEKVICWCNSDLKLELECRLFIREPAMSIFAIILIRLVKNAKYS